MVITGVLYLYPAFEARLGPSDAAPGHVVEPRQVCLLAKR